MEFLKYTLSLLTLLCLFIIPSLEIYRRIDQEKKLKELFEDRSMIKRFPPFFDVLPGSIPKTENGKIFLKYRKEKAKITTALIVLAVIVMISSSRFANQL